MTMTDIAIAPLTDAEAAQMQVDLQTARSTPCSVAGCDHSGHMIFDSPADWAHRFARGEEGLLRWELYVEHGVAAMYLGQVADREGVTAEQARAIAVELETAPARLRALADELDQRNA